MSQSKITAGEWIVQRDPDYSEGLHPYHETRFITTEDCNLSGHGDNPGVIICSMRDSIDHQANARAIAAVPKMIEALLGIMKDDGDRESDLILAKRALREAGIEVD